MSVDSKSNTVRGCGRVDSGIRRALALFGMQVASWWDLDETVAYLELLGYTVVSLPFREWDLLTESNERKEYLGGKLRIQACYRSRKSAG
jgi:hypothetical protein